MKIINFKTLLLLLFFAATSLSAETTYTVDQAVTIAMNNNSSILQEKIRLSGLQRKKNKSLNGLSPSLSVGAGVAYPNEPSMYDHSAYFLTNISFSFSATIATDVTQAKINYEAGMLSKEMLLNTIELSVRKSFYGLLHEKINIDLQKHNLETSKTRYEQTEAKYRAGRITEIDVVSAKVNWENLKPTLSAAETTWKNDLESFKQLIGIDQKEEISLDGSLDHIIDLGDITIEGITAKSNDVRSLEKLLELTRAKETEAQLNAYSPRLSLGYTYQPSKGFEPVNPIIPESKWEDTGTLSAAVTMPLDGILPWSEASENISSAHDNVKILEMQLNEAKISASLSVKSLLRKIAQSQAAIKALRENVVLAERSYAMMSEAYRYGVKDLLSLEQSADSLFQSKVNLISEAYNLISSILELENQIGAPFGSIGK